MRKFISAGMMLILSFSLVSCSAMMAVKKPDKKDLNVLAVGTPRDIVISEFGLPDKTEKNSQGLRVDIWSFKQGDAKGVKAGKAIFHLVADIFTCFLWKIIGMPAEVLLEKDLKTYIVTYDSSDRVYEVKVLAKK